MQTKESDYSLNKNISTSDRKIMLFDLSIRGHHSNYIQHLIKYWHEQKLSGSLDIVVSPRFLKEHADVVDLTSSYSQGNSNFIAISSEEEAILNSRKSHLKRAFRNFQEWQILCKYAEVLKASHCLIMYFDTCELPLALGVKAPCPFSGIYFRPSFHYDEFTHYMPSWKDRMQKWRQKLFLFRILRNPKLKNLFCLDPFVVKYLERYNSNVTATPLPDPVEIFPNLELQLKNFQESLEIETGRKVFLLFGALTERKGIYQLLEALLALSSGKAQKICLLLVGESRIETQLESRIKAVCQLRPVQIISHYKFVSEQDVQAYFQLADVVLAPYQRHVGMSGILLLAAAAQKPVLSSDYGLMGEIVRRYELGLTVDSTIPSEIAKGLTQFLLEFPTELCDRAKMKSFAETNSAERFAQVIFKHI